MGSQKQANSRLFRLLSHYYHESARPLVSLVFITPLIVAYEGGLLWLGPQAMRNGADLWLRQLLELLGFSQYFLLPLLTCSLLLGWHHLNRERWRVGWTVCYGMLLESFALGFAVLLLAHVQAAALSSLQAGASPPLALADPGAYRLLVAFLGAGIYEELLFRLMMFPALAAVLRIFGAPSRTSWLLALVLSSLIFAAAHYRWDLFVFGFHLQSSFGDTWQLGSFLFRFSAGAFFGVLFLTRGFGVAAAAHACYDILVAVL